MILGVLAFFTLLLFAALYREYVIAKAYDDWEEILEKKTKDIPEPDDK